MMRPTRRRLASGLAVLLLCVVVLFALNAQTTAAAEFTSYVWKWTPKSDATASGVTTIRARKHLGSGLSSSDASMYTTFRASNRTTRFYDKNHATGKLVRMSRNVFFRHVRFGSQPQAISIKWTWRTARNGVRYRFVTSVTAYHLYRSNTVALFGDSLMETRYLDATENTGSTVLPAGYDGRLHVVVQSKLDSDLGVHASTQNWSVGGMDSSGALRPHHRVRNGVTGLMAPSVVTPWADLLATHPDVVVINFGAVDVGQKIGIADFKRNIKMMVTQAEAQGVAVVLATCLAYDYPAHFKYDRNAQLEPYSDTIVSIANDYGVALADNRAAFEASIALGKWDLFGRRDSSYLAWWENGSVPGTVEYETQHHPWVAGVGIMADTITAAVAHAVDGSPSSPTPWWLWSPLFYRAASLRT